jgi:dienelactone hydrolase
MQNEKPQAAAGKTSDAPTGSPNVRRWSEQRWLIDNIIKANGPEWDQPRLASLNVALGPEAAADTAAIRQRVQKLADMSPAFAWAASMREQKANTAADQGLRVTARDNFFMAANYWAAAQWSIDENTVQQLHLNRRKRECFLQFAQLADRRVEDVWIPFEDRALPGWLHLPPGYSGGRIPLVVSIPGMDGFKERSVNLYGDPWLNRGIAVLAVEGPGQYESAVLGIHVSMQAWQRTGRAVMDWLLTRSEIDPARIGIIGRSFGTFFASIALAHEPRFCAGAIHAPCLEPGCRTIFEEASPTYKRRFMYMAGFTEEDAFDAFRTSLTWEGHAQRMTAPFLCIAGEADELSPIAHVHDFMRALRGPKRLVVYEGARHTVAGVSSTHLGPSPASVMADWMAARLAGEPFESERWQVDGAGRVTKTAL